MTIEDVSIHKDLTLKDALKKLDRNAQGTLFIIDNDKKLLGILTDGDIRRALLADVVLDEKVHNVMNTKFVSLPNTTDNNKILEQINRKIRIIPLVDEEGILVDYASINRLRNISISSPLLLGNELVNLTDCINTNWISSQGKYVREFERLFHEHHEGFTALAVSNGTVALHLALVALGVGKGDEVLVPNLTFAASINAVLYTGATPVLVDVEEGSWNIDLAKAEQLINKRTKAIMPVHLYGQPCDMDALDILVNKHNLLVVEDCAEALGSRYKDRPVGVFGDAATFSFFGNKTITTGEGGMILFRDPAIAAKAATLRDHGMNKDKRYWHDEVGFNYRLTNLQSAIGVAQFERLQFFVDAKRKLAQVYTKNLERYSFIQVPQENEKIYSSFWLYSFLIKDTAPFTRDELMKYLQKKGIETRPVFYPLHIMPPYQTYAKEKEMKISTYISDRGMSLPSAVGLSDHEQKYICNCISSFMTQDLTNVIEINQL